MNVIKKPFGQYEGHGVDSYTLQNDSGMEVMFITYGGAITNMLAPDRKGKFENVVLGFDTLEQYVEHEHYYGALIGRVAGRIGGAGYSSHGKRVELTANENGNHLHGGDKGFNRVIWTVGNVAVEKDEVSVYLSYLSPDGEEGYRGNIKVDVTYTLTNANEFTIAYRAVPDHDTPINMTSHSYFNLSGDYKEDILSHTLQMNADEILDLAGDLVPTGKLIPVEGTPFDFHDGKTILAGMQSGLEEGYDHAFVLNKKDRGISLWDEKSGRAISVETDQQSVVLYTGNHLTDDVLTGGVRGRSHLGLCLETQGFPDAVNHPHFPSVTVKKGDVYSASTTFRFHVINSDENQH
ncbi:aldose epimerase family protein [Rossellomorea sp. YZS02]|uniref:aldose epimerase family protein n=1 Tax=Rossellomorea sp. YZS02 TaxID=3097358 RepID=UPI002A168838|nr:aldose epimerase family protein [Rossellomorea sp. YZS02]MDX8343114.1 aldose epimerase family protein [Rossellomorea sp. YZS02]